MNLSYRNDLGYDLGIYGRCYDKTECPKNETTPSYPVTNNILNSIINDNQSVLILISLLGIDHSWLKCKSFVTFFSTGGIRKHQKKNRCVL